MKIFKIEENDANQRLDKFLKKLFPNATRSLIYKLNRKEKVKVKHSPQSSFESDTTSPHLTGDSKKFRKKDNEYKLQVGDEVKIFLSDDEFEKLKHPIIFPKNEGKPHEVNKMNFKEIVVFEDNYLLVLNKNPGVNVHPGDYKTNELSLIQQVHDYLGDKLNSLTFKPSLVHRIDRDTSGIIIIAKKKDILTRLVNDFKNHKKVKKIYYAIVLGKLTCKTGTIDKKLERIENAKNENKVQISEKGQKAITHYKVLKEHNLKTKEGDLTISELEVEIETGRMHQIRVHLAGLGNPVLGDKTYGDKRLNSYFERNFGVKRQMLHAWKIEFFHYGRERIIKLEARLKEDMKNFI